MIVLIQKLLSRIIIIMINYHQINTMLKSLLMN